VAVASRSFRGESLLS